MAQRSTLAVVVGIRSQYVKLAGLLHLRQECADFPDVDLDLVDTGQHYDAELTTDILGEDWPEFDVRFRHPPGSSAASVFASSVQQLVSYWERRMPPNAVLVFGDGSPAAVGAVAAAKMDIPVVHVEAGERRGAHEQEEINRRLIDGVAQMFLCVSERGVEVLRSEGHDANVFHVGDLSYRYMAMLQGRCLRTQVDEIGSEYHAPAIVVALHRPENLEVSTVEAAVWAAHSMGRPVVVLAHPRLRALLKDCDLECEPVVRISQSYFDSINMLCTCAALVTDSGGLIREAHLLNTPTVVRRDAGGWPTLADGNTLVRSGRSSDEIVEALRKVVEAPGDRRIRSVGSSPILPEAGVTTALAALAKSLRS